MSNEFPANLRQFISQNIESLAQLEVVLLLYREVERAWTTEDIAKELYIAPEMAEVILNDLSRRGMVANDGKAFRYNSDGASNDEMLALLTEAYRERRVAVITEIYSRPQKKVQTFADSFRFRKED
jgi:hypothetical protein